MAWNLSTVVVSTTRQMSQQGQLVVGVRGPPDISTVWLVMLRINCSVKFNQYLDIFSWFCCSKPVNTSNTIVFKAYVVHQILNKRQGLRWPRIHASIHLNIGSFNYTDVGIRFHFL